MTTTTCPFNVLRNGSLVPPCTGAFGQAVPDPCITNRTSQPVVDDLDFFVLTSQASLWTFAADMIPVAGTSMVLKDNDDDPTKRKITIVAKDPSITAPPPGTSDDPTCGVGGGGGAVWITGTGGSGQSVSFALPCEGWQLLGSAAAPKGYKYTDKDQLRGPCKLAMLKAGKSLKVVCSAKNPAFPITYDLTIGEGSVAMSVGVGGTLGYCAEYGGSAVVKDDAGTFHAKKAPAPSSCAAVP